MFNTIVIVLKCGTGIIRRIDKNTFDLSGKALLQSLQRQQVVPEDEPVIENIVSAYLARGVGCVG